MIDPIINGDDTDPEDGWPDAYSTVIPRVERAQKKRANNLPSIPWKQLTDMIIILEDYVQFLQDRWMDRQPDAQQVAKMRNKLIPRDAEICAVENPKSTLSQFWKFVQINEKKLLYASDVISKTRLRAFIAYCEHMELRPASVLSKINHLIKFLNWLKGKPSYQPKERHIERFLEQLRNRMEGLSAANDKHRDNKNEQRKKDNAPDMLTGQEIVDLNNKCWGQIAIIINTINERQMKQTKLRAPQKIASEFQTCLQIICLLNIGAQRRQVIAGLTEEEIIAPSSENESFGFIKPTREKVKRKTSSSIPVPKKILKLIDYFKVHVRKLFDPSPNIESIWLACGGVVQQGSSLTKAVKKQIARFLPGKDITPADLRACIPTNIFKENFKGDCETIEEALKRYSKIVNTGYDVLLRHYIRYHEHRREESFISNLNQRFNENDMTRDLQFTVNAVLEISKRIEELKKQGNNQPDVQPTAEDQQDKGAATFDVPVIIVGAHLLEGNVSSDLYNDTNENAADTWGNILQNNPSLLTSMESY